MWKHQYSSSTVTDNFYTIAFGSCVVWQDAFYVWPMRFMWAYFVILGLADTRRVKKLRNNNNNNNNNNA